MEVVSGCIQWHKDLKVKRGTGELLLFPHSVLSSTVSLLFLFKEEVVVQTWIYKAPEALPEYFYILYWFLEIIFLSISFKPPRASERITKNHPRAENLSNLFVPRTYFHLLTSLLSISLRRSSSRCLSSSRCFSSCFSSSCCRRRSCSCRSRSLRSCSSRSRAARRSCSLRCCSSRAWRRFSSSRLPRSKFSLFLSSKVTAENRAINLKPSLHAEFKYRHQNKLPWNICTLYVSENTYRCTNSHNMHMPSWLFCHPNSTY